MSVPGPAVAGGTHGTGKSCNGALEAKLAAARQLAYVRSADQGLLQKSFELTPAEAQLAALLYDGASVKHAAAKLGITEGSARQYLRRIFAKTGTNRQVDLVREIARTMAAGPE